jgi:hypothetical protein
MFFLQRLLQDSRSCGRTDDVRTSAAAARAEVRELMPHQSILSGSGACPSLSSPLQCGCAWDRLVSSPSRTDRCGLHSRLALVRTYAVRRVQSAALSRGATFERLASAHILGTYNGVNAVYAAVYANYAVHYACSFATNAHTPFVDRLPQPYAVRLR